MKKFKYFYILFFMFFVINITSVNAASIQSGYVKLKDTNGITKVDKLNITTPVTYSVHFEKATAITCTYNGKTIPINDPNAQMTLNNNKWIMCKLPSCSSTQNCTVPGVVKIVYIGAAYNSSNQFFDVEVTIDNIRFLGLKANGSRNGANYVSIYRSVGQLWLDYYGYKTYNETDYSKRIDKNTDYCTNGVLYDVNFRIVGATSNNTFIFSAQDLDVANKSSGTKTYGDNSEGMIFISGFYKNTLQVTKKSLLCGKYSNGDLQRITGSKQDDDTEKSGFVVIANASGTKFSWRAGYNCGTTFVSKWQPPLEELEDKTIEVKYRDYNNGTPLVIDSSYDYSVKINGNERLNINRDSHPSISNINSVIEKKGYKYKGVQLDSGTISNENVISMNVDKNNSIVTFYYIKADIPKIDIWYREWDGTADGKLIPGIGTSYDTKKEMANAMYITRNGGANSAIIQKKYVYKGATKGKSIKENVDTVENSIYTAPTDERVTFWYLPKEDKQALIRVIGVYQPTKNNYSTQFEMNNNDTGIKKVPFNSRTYTPESWQGYEYSKKYKIIYGMSEYNGDNSGCITGNKATLPTLTEDMSENKRTVLIVFYYEKERDITLYFKDISTGDEIPGMPPQKGKDGVNTRPLIKDYEYVGVEEVKPVAVPISDDISVNVLKDGKDYEIIFWYKVEEDIPKLIFGDPDPNPKPVPNYEELKYKIKEQDPNAPQENGLLYPDDLNNQYVGSTPSGIWVLEEDGKIVVRYATTIVNNPTFDFELSFPFYISYKGKSTKLISIKNMQYTNFNLNGENNYIGYQSEINDIRIPLNTTEKDYNKGIVGKLTFRCTELGDDFIKGIEKASVTVVGAVYDFKVTNLDGSSITGDEVWHKYLFEDEVEYGATTLPVGQYNSNITDIGYKYGIKKGTKFYFSVNTKGKKNTEIEIVPKYYFYDSSGSFKGEVHLYDGDDDKLSIIRKTSLRDSNRFKSEYVKEFLKGLNIYSGIYKSDVMEIGNYKTINISTGLRMPFVNYGIDKVRFHEITSVTDTTIKNVSHWYADFTVMNNAILYNSSNEKIDNDGYLVVCFSIKTKDSGGNYYLAYNLETPFNQIQKESEWKYEKGNSSKAITLPNKKTDSSLWKNLLKEINENGYAPVLIYQANISTAQNVDAVTTH